MAREMRVLKPRARQEAKVSLG
jgi:hypothetical protein